MLTWEFGECWQLCLQSQAIGLERTRTQTHSPADAVVYCSPQVQLKFKQTLPNNASTIQTLVTIKSVLHWFCQPASAFCLHLWVGQYFVLLRLASAPTTDPDLLLSMDPCLWHHCDHLFLALSALGEWQSYRLNKCMIKFFWHFLSLCKGEWLLQKPAEITIKTSYFTVPRCNYNFRQHSPTYLHWTA